jgi:hypothetical protein
MKTTIDISEKLLKKAKAAAKSKNTTLKQIIEDSLRLSLGLTHPKKFKLIEASFGDEASKKPFPSLDWEKIRGEIYGDEK